MPDEINFLDLAALMQIKPDTTVERYGGMINSSFFDAANVLGTLSQKKLISFTTSFPGQNPITITDVGKQLIVEANEKAKQDFDHLDLAILTQLHGGKRTPNDIGTAVNVRSKDLAFHIYKLTNQEFTTYEFRNGVIEIMLTEKGFSQVKTGMPMKPGQAAMPLQPMAQPQSLPTTDAQTMAGPVVSPAQPRMEQPPMPEIEEVPPEPLTPEQVEAKIKADQSKKKMMLIIAVIVIIILIAGGYYYFYVI